MKEFGLERFTEVLWPHWNSEHVSELLLQSFRDPIIPTALTIVTCNMNK